MSNPNIENNKNYVGWKGGWYNQWYNTMNLSRAKALQNAEKNLKYLQEVVENIVSLDERTDEWWERKVARYTRYGKRNRLPESDPFNILTEENENIYDDIVASVNGLRVELVRGLDAEQIEDKVEEISELVDTIDTTAFDEKASSDNQYVRGYKDFFYDRVVRALNKVTNDGYLKRWSHYDRLLQCLEAWDYESAEKEIEKYPADESDPFGQRAAKAVRAHFEAHKASWGF